MKNFFGNLAAAYQRWMIGRNGPDALGLCALAVSLILSFIPGGHLLSLAGLAYCIWRMLSRNVARRREENGAFLAKTAGIRTKLRQFANRQKNRKEYKYFRCPKCKTLIRLKRGQGTVHGKCPRCAEEYDQNT